MCSSIYIGALSAMSLIATAPGRSEDSSFYQNLAERGAQLMDETLFNGEYYQQNVDWRNTRDSSLRDLLQSDSRSNAPEAKELFPGKGLSISIAPAASPTELSAAGWRPLMAYIFH